MRTTVFFLILGYLSGSILFANVFGTLFGKRDLYKNSPDQNPGTANAYQYGGFWCGTLTLVGDLLKGFLPVFFYLQAMHIRLQTMPVREEWELSLVLAAPVIGHIFPVFYRFRGGKGIATTFGCLLGLFPYGLPVVLFAAVFIFLSVGLRITPHYYRTIAAYLITAAVMVLTGIAPAVRIGFFVIAGVVCLRMYLSKEEKERIGVRLLWMR